MNKEDKNNLIIHRIEKAEMTVEEVNFLLENKKYSLAVNRIYYSN